MIRIGGNPLFNRNESAKDINRKIEALQIELSKKIKEEEEFNRIEKIKHQDIRNEIIEIIEVVKKDFDSDDKIPCVIFEECGEYSDYGKSEILIMNGTNNAKYICKRLNKIIKKYNMGKYSKVRFGFQSFENNDLQTALFGCFDNLD
jgi:hypothetical protein